MSKKEKPTIRVLQHVISTLFLVFFFLSKINFFMLNLSFDRYNLDDNPF